MRLTIRSFLLLFASVAVATGAESTRSLRFQAATKENAVQWQRESRQMLFKLLMGGQKPEPGPLDPRTLRREEVPAGGYVIEELTLQTLPDRRAHVWLAAPKDPRARVGAVLALHGHGGNGEEIVRGLSLYWYGRALAEMGYVIIAPDIGQHELQHTNWSLMGERTWDALRCLDYLETRPEVDPRRLTVAGLSLGGETTMYVAALDERVKAACSSGWLTTVANLKNGHCPCWNFPGLEQHFEFADVFACVAPRPLVCEVGEKERAPGGFPVPVARGAFEEIRAAYRVFDAEQNVKLTVHAAGHVFDGRDFWGPLHDAIGLAWPWSREVQAVRDESLRRGEIARRCFSRALGVLDGWWKTRDATTGLYPRRLDQPVWAPQDNAADMFPFLALTAHCLAPERLPEILEILPKERALTTRAAGLPDWFSLTNRAFTYAGLNTNRLIFGAAEYCKDGLIPMTEEMGRGPWFDRMVELMDAIFAAAPVLSDFGLLPADDTEVNGDLLQALARLYAATRDLKYFNWAARIADAYCREVLPGNGGLPPHRWDFTQHRVLKDVLNLNDHGNEIIGGLAECYVVANAWHPAKARAWREPLSQMFHRLLDRGRNADGLWFNLLRASTGAVLNRETPDTWGYAFSAAVAFGRADKDESLVEAARRALRHINRPRYLHWSDADAYADSLEGALYLLNRLPTTEGFDWLETMLPLFLGKQRDDGIVEGWYGDGNYARTALLLGLYYTQGVRCQPWRADVRLGAVRDGEALRLAISADRAWSGQLLFDTPRHHLHLRLPVNYPRLNEFPEWYPVETNVRYAVDSGGGKPKMETGAALARGLPLELKPGEVRVIKVRPLVRTAGGVSAPSGRAQNGALK
jgi:Abhydrolase family